MRAMVVSDFTPGGHGTQQRRGFCLLDELTSCGLTPRLICRSDTAAQVGRSLARVTRDVRWCEGAKVLGFAAAHAGTPGWLLVPEDVIASAAQWGLEADVWCALGPWSAAVLEAAAERLGHRPDLWITDLGRPGSVTLQRRGGVTAKGRVALLRESEQRAAGLSDLTLVECRADAAELGLLERGPWWAVGNGYAVSGDPEAGAMARLRPRLLLAADEGSPEQVKAVVQAVRLVLPLVRRSVADAEVVAAGVRLPRAWRKLAKLPGVDLVELDPMRPTVAWRTLAQSAVAGLAVGKRRGGETSRILGLMAEGRPVVGDPALRGAGGRGGRNAHRRSGGLADGGGRNEIIATPQRSGIRRLVQLPSGPRTCVVGVAVAGPWIAAAQGCRRADPGVHSAWPRGGTRTRGADLWAGPSRQLNGSSGPTAQCVSTERYTLQR